jgi:hypothetical protein
MDNKQNKLIVEAYQNSINNLEKDIKKFRIALEKEYGYVDDNMCLKGTCHTVTEKLVKYLKNLNYKNAKRVPGYYTNVSDDFEPDGEMWDNDDWEDFYENFDNTWKHWWVEVGDKIVDVTADQFHPGDEDEYKVVIVNKTNKDYKRL